MSEKVIEISRATHMERPDRPSGSCQIIQLVLLEVEEPNIPVMFIGKDEQAKQRIRQLGDDVNVLALFAGSNHECQVLSDAPPKTFNRIAVDLHRYPVFFVRVLFLTRMKPCLHRLLAAK